MKLLAQTNRRYFLISLGALILGSGALFLGVKALFDEYADERLFQMEEEIIAYVNTCDTLPIFFQSTSEKLLGHPVAMLPRRSVQDTILFNALEQEEEPFRRLRFGLKIHGEPFQVDILQSTVETEDIAETVLMLNLALIIALFSALFWVQKRMSVQLWKPFYDTLEGLRSFQLAQPNALKLGQTDTHEFAELNAALERLTEKTRQDYHSLKRFTENASHEIQTPLAIIRAKLDMLLQSDGLNDAQLTHLHQTQLAAARLSRLQQNLLLLVKIENDQFQAVELVDLNQVVTRKLEQLEDFIAAKKLSITTALSPVQLQLDPTLAETLISNLIGNAVKHNINESGWISITLRNEVLLIENSGLAPEIPASELTERFRRSSIQEGLGLGLAIAQEICEQYDWILEVRFEAGAWKVAVFFQA